MLYGSEEASIDDTDNEDDILLDEDGEDGEDLTEEEEEDLLKMLYGSEYVSKAEEKSEIISVSQDCEDVKEKIIVQTKTKTNKVIKLNRKMISMKSTPLIRKRSFTSSRC